jgi:hypothetical protein
MNKKTLNIALLVTSFLAFGGIIFYVMKKHEQKVRDEIYKKSLEDMSNEFGNEIFK